MLSVRSSSQVPKLPDIEHPLCRLRRSNSGIGGIGTDRFVSGTRPMGSESICSSSRPASTLSRCSSSRSASVRLSVIPESVATFQGSPGKTKLPLFGNRQDMASRVSIGSCRSAQNDTIEDMEEIKERLKNNFSEIRKRFKDNDPEHKGNITREALQRVLQTLMGKEISQNKLSKILQQLNFKPDKQVFTFHEFYAPFLESEDNKFPSYVDPIQRKNTEILRLNSNQTHAYLKNLFRKRLEKIAECFPALIKEEKESITHAQLKCALDQLNISIHESEFERLCCKYDPMNSGQIKGIDLLASMGILVQSSHSISDETKSPRKKDLERQRSLRVENFLKDKFREAFKVLRGDFENYDPDKLGVVSIDNFLEVINRNGLNLEKIHLKEFLARTLITPSKEGIPYRDFLHRFQDRSEAGITHRTLNRTAPVPKPTDKCDESLSALENQLIQMFQRDFLTLLKSFRQIDRFDTNAISQEEFRAVLESKFELEFTSDQFRRLIDNIPLDRNGLVLYNEFMKQFDTNGVTPSMFSLKEKKKDENLIQIENLVLADDNLDTYRGRKIMDILKVIKDLVDNRFTELQTICQDLDEKNSGRIDVEMMYRVFQTLELQPEITRGEIRSIWPVFIKNIKNTVDIKEFFRFFLFDPEKLTFPNAKVCPPIIGDADLMKRSRKLNSTRILLEDNIRSKIDYLFEDMRKEFIELDRAGTGVISKDIFNGLLKELCVQLSDFEIEQLTKKFETGGKVSYLEFMRPFVLRRQAYRHGSDMLALLHHPVSTEKIKGGKTAEKHFKNQKQTPTGGDIEKTKQFPSNLQTKLSKCNWREARRHLRKIDATASGMISMEELRAILQLVDTSLEEEDCFNIQSLYDPMLSGFIDYPRLIQDALECGKA